MGDKPSEVPSRLSFSCWTNGRTKEALLTYVQGGLAVPHSLDVKAQTGLGTCSCRRLRKRRLCSVKRTKHYLPDHPLGEVGKICPRKKVRGYPIGLIIITLANRFWSTTADAVGVIAVGTRAPHGVLGMECGLTLGLWTRTHSGLALRANEHSRARGIFIFTRVR